MVTTSQDPSGKFRLKPLKDKSDDVMEVGLAGQDDEKKYVVEVKVLSKLQDVDWCIEAYKKGNRMIMINTQPMTTAKNKEGELKRAEDRIKLQVEKTGRIMRLGGTWLLLIPNEIEILD